MYHTVLHTDNKYAAPSRSGQLEQAIPNGEVGHRAHLVPQKSSIHRPTLRARTGRRTDRPWSSGIGSSTERIHGSGLVLVSGKLDR